jgi:hypothetical protein
MRRGLGKVSREPVPLRFGRGHGYDNLCILVYRRFAGMTPFLNMSNQIRVVGSS